MFKATLALIIEVVISVAVAWMADSFAPAPQMTLLIGIITFFAIEHTRLRVAVARTLAVSNTLAETIESIGHFDEFSELRLIYGLRGIHNLLRDSVKVEKEDVFDFWSDSLTRTRTKWQAISYISEAWELGSLQELANRVQAERIAGGIQIERLFLVDSSEEEAKLEAVMKAQHETKVTVGHVFAVSLLALPSISEGRAKIGSLDFAIVDDQWVYITYLDFTRKMTSAGATKKPEILQAARLLFNEAHTRAKILK